MADDLRLYDVTVDGHRTHMRLNDADAAAMGAAAVLALPAATPDAQPIGPLPGEGITPGAKNRPVTSNKMRTSETVTDHATDRA